QLVDLARGAPQDLGQLLEHAVAHLVAVRVVDLLEVVEVEHHDGDGLARPLRPLELLVEDLLDVAVVVEAGEAVADAELRELEVLLLELLLEALDAEHRADAGLELGEVDRLGEVVVRPGIEAGDLVACRVPDGHEDDRDERERIVALDAARDLVAVDPGEHDVEQDQVGWPLVHAFQGFFAARSRLDLVAAEAEAGREHLEVVRTVIHDEDAAAVRPVRNTVAARGHGSNRAGDRRERAAAGPVTRAGPRGRCRLEDEPHPSSLHTSLSSGRRVPVPRSPGDGEMHDGCQSRPAPPLTRRVGGTYGSSARYGKTGVPSRRAAPGAATSGPPGHREPRHAPCGTGVASLEQPRQVEVGMYYDEEWRALSFVAGLTLGMALGAGVALLMAPQSGRRTRRQLAKAVASARDTAEDRFGEMADEVRSAVDAGRRRLRL